MQLQSRRTLPLSISAVILTLALAAAPSCAALQKFVPQKPDFKLERIEFVGFTLSAAKLKLFTSVSNPYPVTLPKASLDLEMRVQGVRLARLKTAQTGIRAYSTSRVVFDVSLPYSSLYRIYRRWPRNQSLDTSLKGVLNIPLPAMARDFARRAAKNTKTKVPDKLTFKFEAKKKIPAVLPSLKIRNFRIIKPSTQEIKSAAVNMAKNAAQNPGNAVRKATSFVNSLLRRGGRSPGSAVQAGLKELDIKIRTEFEIVMTNKAAARLNFNGLQYVFRMNGEKFLDGRSAGIKNQGRTSIIKVATSFPLSGVSSSIASAIKRRSVSYQLVGHAAVAIPAIQSGDIRYDFDQSGRHRW